MARRHKLETAVPPVIGKGTMGSLKDQFDREFHYLRLSVTDVCNFRCSYCLPNGFKRTQTESVLSPVEIENLVSAFARMGVWKVRLTGGEPTLRPDLIEIVERISKIDGIRFVALSTNGWHLPQLVKPLREAGLQGLNVSLDSFDRGTFHKITGHDRMDTVLEGIEAALDSGFKKIKLNTVLLRGLTAESLDTQMEWIRNRDVTIRFIELMRTGDNKEFFDKYHVSGDQIIADLKDRGWVERVRGKGAGPAREFESAGFLGGLGVIAPYSKDFCKACNRLRVSSRGRLQLCLFGEGQFTLRPWLRSAHQAGDVIEAVQSALKLKKVSHHLAEYKYGMTNSLSSIGG